MKDVSPCHPALAEVMNIATFRFSVRKLMNTSLLISLFLLLEGCATMSANSKITFSEHYVSYGYFLVNDLKITYGNRSVADTSSLPHMKRPTRAKLPRDEWPSPHEGGFRAFEGPLKVSWIALDGTHLSDKVNLDDVFNRRVVLYDEEVSNIDSTDPLMGSYPLIYIEVNDRMVSIYMIVRLSVRHKDSALRERVATSKVLAYTRTF